MSAHCTSVLAKRSLQLLWCGGRSDNETTRICALTIRMGPQAGLSCHDITGYITLLAWAFIFRHRIPAISALAVSFSECSSQRMATHTKAPINSEQKGGGWLLCNDCPSFNSANALRHDHNVCTPASLIAEPKSRTAARLQAVLSVHGCFTARRSCGSGQGPAAAASHSGRTGRAVRGLRRWLQGTHRTPQPSALNIIQV